MVMAAAIALASARRLGGRTAAGAGATARSAGASWGSATALSSMLTTEAADRSDRPLGRAHDSQRAPGLPPRQLSERGLDASCERAIDQRDLVHQAGDGRPHRPPQLWNLERTHQRAFEPLPFVWRKAIRAATLPGWQAV